MKNTKNSEERCLEGLCIGISVSESNESGALGFGPAEVNRAVRRLSETLLACGARLVLGHDWRPGGVMEEICLLASRYAPLAGEEATSRARIVNCLPWPRRASLSRREREALAPVLRIVETGLPPELEKHASAAEKDPGLKAYLQARALARMREEIARETAARLCIGGKTSGFSGAVPGVAEEAFVTAELRRPLFLSGLYGGAAREMIRAILTGKADPDAFRPSGEMAAALLCFASEHGEVRSPEEIASFFSGLGLEGLSELNGLTPQENKEMFDALTLDRVSVLLLSGLRRLREKEPTGESG